MADLRSLPSVDHILQTQPAEDWIRHFGRPLSLAAVRDTLEEIRQAFHGGDEIPSEITILERIQKKLEDWTAPTLKPVINASGVILHTNLGRAPLSAASMSAIQNVALGYSNLEYDLSRGERGSRLVHAETLLQRLTGAEAALVVNNNAAAILLILTTLARRRGVVIARSQLVEIGGGFRIPDVMKQSGARLLEVGATNRVHLADYAAALEEKPALILHAHRSNFQILGFTSEPELAEMATLARQAGIPLVDDLGSGALLDTSCYGLRHEPTIQESLQAGADLVCFSGDKLLGGPQAGILVGKAALIARLRKHPLARAIRADKLCLAALTATLLHYLKNEAEKEIPIWRMISTSAIELENRARQWQTHLGLESPFSAVVSGLSTVGGGSMPGETLPSYLLTLAVQSPDRFLSRLRQTKIPVIARLENARAVFDPRTVLIEQEKSLLAAISSALKGNL